LDPPGGYFKKILSKNEKCSISCIIRISYIVYIKVNRTAVMIDKNAACKKNINLRLIESPFFDIEQPSSTQFDVST